LPALAELHARTALQGLLMVATGEADGRRMMHSDVLIVGAGPTGLVLALWLTRLGVKVRIVDKTAEPGTTSRALAVQARILELYRQLDLTDAVLKLGHKVPAVNLWVKGEPATRLSFERIGSDLTPYSFLHIFPQDQHERLLIERLETLGVSVATSADRERLVSRQQPIDFGARADPGLQRDPSLFSFFSSDRRG
jgi:2-polyprenyl-6-methoxyphenol hydroxylase-like FAD-dependent oxidoreductase